MMILSDDGLERLSWQRLLVISRVNNDGLVIWSLITVGTSHEKGLR